MKTAAFTRFRKELKKRLAEQELPDWRPLRFVLSGTGSCLITQERIQQPEFVRQLLPNLPTDDYVVADFNRNELQRALAPEHFKLVQSLFEQLIEQSEVAHLAVLVAESELDRVVTGRAAGQKSGQIRRARTAKRDAQIIDNPEGLDTAALGDRHDLKADTVRKKRARAKKS